MRSHLARNVYRRLLLAHRPHGLLLLPPCPAAPAGRRCLHRCTAPVIRPQRLPGSAPRRSFFGVFQKPPRELKEPDLEPGYEMILQFRSRETDNVRPPPRDELVQAFRMFFHYKQRYRKRVNSTQAFCSLHLFRHLLETAGDAEELPLQDLRIARDTLLRPPNGNVEDHLRLSKELYEEIRRRALAERGDGASRDAAVEGEGVAGEADFESYVAALSQYDAATEAIDQITQYLRETRRNLATDSYAAKLWILVLRGLAKEGREAELLQQIEALDRMGVGYSPAMHEVMVQFYAQQDRIDEAQRWFQRPISGRHLPTPEAYATMLKLSVRKQKFQKWLKTLFQELCDLSQPSKAHWDVVFQWAVLALGKGVEDVKRMIETMARHNEGSTDVVPDIATINGLVHAAIEKNDFLLAERFISLGLEMELEPDHFTHLLQLDYRIDANDLSGAYEAFESLHNAGFPSDEDHPVINKYIRALCASPHSDVEAILDVTGTVEHRRIVLEPETIVALCMTFLKNDQQYEVIDTLSLHTLHVSLEQRKIIRDALVAYCLNSSTSTARVWDGYSLLRQFFPETEAEARIKLMDAFFARRRPDMACYIFGHMRSHNNHAIRPSTDTYIRCLEGLGRCPDYDSLKMVHNMLKMDATVQPNTKLYNGLMIAYLACEEPQRALDFWQDITNSTEGPTYNSLAIVFQVLQSRPFGDELAKQIWNKMQRMEIDVPQFVFTAYCGAIAGQGHVEEVKKLIQEGLEARTGYTPHIMTLGVPYNALPGQTFQESYEEWAKEAYPEVWEKLVKRGRKTTPEGLKNFRIVRELKA